MSSDRSKPSIQDFEKRFRELEKTVERMEAGDQSLEASLADFEKGMALLEGLRESLAAAERKVQVLVKRDAGETLEDFEPSGEN